MIVDSHSHYTYTAGMKFFDSDFDDYINHMDFEGIDCLVQSLVWGLTPEVRKDVHIDYAKICLDLYEKSNHRIFNNFVFDPRIADTDLAAIEKYHDNPAFVGIKIHPSDVSVYADDECYRVIWETAKKYNLPIMSHTWALTSNPKQKYATPERFVKYLDEFPEVSFVFGHTGGRVAGIKKCMEIGKKYKNTYFDIAGDIYNRHLIEYMAENVGADRIMAASDINWFDFAVTMGMVLGADIKSEEKALILGDNAARLYKLYK